jgi:hypothetical protein
MVMGSGLTILGGYPFDVRYSEGSQSRAEVVSDVMADAYDYLSALLSGFKPEIAVIVVDEGDWESRQPYGLPFFNDDDGQIRPGIIVMPAGVGDFWIALGQDLRESSPLDYPRLLEAYPDGAGGLDLQPFFDLVSIHELGHAFEVLGGLRVPTFWLSEIFANLCLHAFVVKRKSASMRTLEVLSIVGAQSTRLTDRFRAKGYSTLEDLETHYTGGEDPMDALNYVWYQYRWQRLAATMFSVDGEDGLIRFWNCFHAKDPFNADTVTTSSLAQLLTAEVSETLGRAIQKW